MWVFRPLPSFILPRTVIFFSGNVDVNELASEAGADYSLQKPFDIAELQRIIVSAIKTVPV